MKDQIEALAAAVFERLNNSSIHSWVLANVDHLGHGCYEMQRNDDLNVYESDTALHHSVMAVITDLIKSDEIPASIGAFIVDRLAYIECLKGNQSQSATKSSLCLNQNSAHRLLLLLQDIEDMEPGEYQLELSQAPTGGSIFADFNFERLELPS